MPRRAMPPFHDARRFSLLLFRLFYYCHYAAIFAFIFILMQREKQERDENDYMTAFDVYTRCYYER
jgi:uncharacterized membrane protein YfhO